jgi:uncharacterized membrane protein
MFRISWQLRWQAYEYVRNSLWLVPGLLVALAIVMGFLLPEVDRHTTTPIGIEFGASSAQEMLGAIVGGMITFTGFVFSILLLAVQFGSSQFSPRMLRGFLRDPTTKISLGVFMATFVFAMMVLRTIGLANDPSFVPDDSITVSLFWLLLSMLLFLRLISRTTQALRVASVVREVGRDGAKMIRHIYPDPAAAEAAVADEELEGLAKEVSRVVEFGGKAGILQSVDVRGLVRIARDSDVVLEQIPPIGDPIAPDMPLFRVYGAGAVDDKRLQRSVAIGDERTLRQDPAFAFRLLADISSKALSPGINDPTTSVQAIDQIELLLRLLARRRLTPGELRDESGRVRFCYPTRSWEDFLSIALDEARQFGDTSAQVNRRLRALLEGLYTLAPSYRLPAVEAQLAMLDASIARVHSDAAERRIAATEDRQGLGTPRRRAPETA